MNHIEATAELDNLLKIAQDAVGGEWESLDGAAAACTLPSGATGAQFGFTRVGPGVAPDEQQAIIDSVVSGWTSRDFVPELGSSTLQGADVTSVRYPASGTGVDGIYLDLEINENGSSVAGQTRCVPGEAREINNELFGDEPTP